MPSLTAAATLDPSDLVDYVDGDRVMELLTNGSEITEGVEYEDVSEIDDNARAVKLTNAAWFKVMMACRRGDIYLGRELVDLANDAVRGQPLLQLVADLFWCSLIRRRRHVEGEPQAKDPSCEDAEKMLEMLQSGHRIFVLDGVTQTSAGGVSIGTYGNELGPPTALSVGEMGSVATGVDPLNRFFGCTSWPRAYGAGGGRGGCC